MHVTLASFIYKRWLGTPTRRINNHNTPAISASLELHHHKINTRTQNVKLLPFRGPEPVYTLCLLCYIRFPISRTSLHKFTRRDSHNNTNTSVVRNNFTCHTFDGFIILFLFMCIGSFCGDEEIFFVHKSCSITYINNFIVSRNIYMSLHNTTTYLCAPMS